MFVLPLPFKVLGASLSAYKVAGPAGVVFLPFVKVHPLAFVAPLVAFA